LGQRRRSSRDGRKASWFTSFTDPDGSYSVVGSGVRQAVLYTEDLELYNRLAAEGHVSVALAEPKLLYRVHGGSLMMNSHLEAFRKARFTREVISARRSGFDPPEYDEFVRSEQAGRWLQRTRVKCADVGAYFYRRAGVAFGRGNRIAAGILAGVALSLAPVYTWGKARMLLASRRKGRARRRSIA
jgi:hypothetical protein